MSKREKTVLSLHIMFSGNVLHPPYEKSQLYSFVKKLPTGL